MTANTCDKCIHHLMMKSQENNGQGQMVCRRYPPVVLLTPVQTPAMGADGKISMQTALVPQSFPPAIKADWTCGEFSPPVLL